MKIIVLSDTHGRGYLIDEVLARHKSYDALLFLGDGLRDFAGREGELSGFASVRGNCDGISFFAGNLSAPTERMLILDGVKILMTHGHEHFVKSGTERLLSYGIKKDADIVLYGHTHIADERYYPEGSEACGEISKKPTYLFNPGSLGSPRDNKATFGVIEIRNGQILLSHGKL